MSVTPLRVPMTPSKVVAEVERRFVRRHPLHSITALIVGIIGACSLTVAADTKIDPTKDRVLYEVGYSHLDTQWRWSYPQVIRQFLPNTMWDNFALFEKYPDYIFNFTGANRYRMMKEYYPESYAKLHTWVKRGRWFPAGSAWEESDVLLPSSESIIRQILYGHRYFKNEFGVESVDYMLPDSFGFPASLPSILSHCDIRGFTTQKLTWGSSVGIPFNIGEWQGLDGHSVIAALNCGSYNHKIKEDVTLDEPMRARLDQNAQRSGIYADLKFFGVGDRGGAPAEESIQWLEKSLTSTGAIKVVSARSDDLFRAIPDAQKAKLQKYKGDLLLTEHSAGSLTSQAYMKRWNHRNEMLAEAAEKASVAAYVLGAAPYPREKLRHAWELVLGAQFHDLLTGTSLPKCYEYSWNDEIIAMNCFASVLTDAVGGVARALDTQVDGQPLVVFNPLSLERNDIVEAEMELPTGTNAQVFDGLGRPLPTQVLRDNGSKTCRILFPATVPSIGFGVFSIKQVNTTNSDEPSSLKVDGRTLENGRYRVTLSDAGDIASIYDKLGKRELLSSPARLAFLTENPKAYPAWNMDWNDRKNPPRGYVSGPATFRIVESGPVRVAIEVERASEDSVFKQTIRLSTGSAADRVEVVNRIDWQSQGCSLKAEFPLTVSNPVATYNWGPGKVERGNNNPKQYEVPAHQWFDLSDTNGAYGVSVLTDAKYGSDKPADNCVRLTLLYTPSSGDLFTEQHSQDWGHHEFTYALAGHEGTWRDGNIDSTAASFTQPLLAFRAATHPGKLGRSFSLLGSSADVAIRTVKLAEDSDDIILRLEELQGKTNNVTFSGAATFRKAAEVSGVERKLKALPVRGGKVQFEIKPFELRSIACTLRAPASLPPRRFRGLDLPYDLDVFSPHNFKQDGNCDELGASMDGEMISNQVVSEGIPFRIGSRENGKPNAVICRGQSIPLPHGPFTQVYFLAAAVRGDTSADFVVDEVVTNLHIQDWSGYLGGWDNRVFRGPVESLSTSIKNPVERIAPGFIKRDPVAWFCSHRHLRDGSDEPYTYTYLFKYRLNLPPNAKTLTLPNSPRIRIIAITAANNPNDETEPAQPLYDDFTNRKTITLSAANAPH